MKLTKTISMAVFATLFLGQIAMANTPTPTAASVIAGAESQAAAEHKNVLVMFHASWCGWCHKLDDFLAKPEIAPLISSNYVTIHIVVQESGDKKDLDNPGGDELLEKLGGKNQGIPYYAILSPTNETLTVSKDAKGMNLGFPGGDSDIPVFIKMLRTTSAHFTDADATLIDTKLHEESKKIAAENDARMKLIKPIQAALDKKDYKQAVIAADAAIVADPKQAVYASFLRYEALLQVDEPKALSEIGKPFGDLDVATCDNDRASVIVVTDSLPKEAYQTALTILLTRMKKSDVVAWNVNSQVARAYSHLHDMKLAVQYQDKAIEGAKAAKVPQNIIDMLVKRDQEWQKGK